MKWSEKITIKIFTTFLPGLGRSRPEVRDPDGPRPRLRQRPGGPETRDWDPRSDSRSWDWSRDRDPKPPTLYAALSVGTYNPFPFTKQQKKSMKSTLLLLILYTKKTSEIEQIYIQRKYFLTSLLCYEKKSGVSTTATDALTKKRFSILHCLQERENIFKKSLYFFFSTAVA